MADRSIESGESLAAAADNLGNGDSMNMSNQADEIDVPCLKMSKPHMKEMEEEAEKIKQLLNDVGRWVFPGTPGLLSLSKEQKIEIDGRSIYVGNVDYGATEKELEAHFIGCGSIKRITILCDKFSGHPKGFAYIEFTNKDSVSTSTALDESLFRGRKIKVLPKRTNRVGISSTNRPPRGRARRLSSPYFSGYRPVRKSFRRQSWYYPY